MVTRSKRAPSTPKTMPITEGRVRPLLMCEGSNVVEEVVGMTVGMILCGDGVCADNDCARVVLLCCVVDTMLIVVAVTELSDVVSVSSTSMSFEIVTVTETVGATIIKLRELADSSSPRAVLP